MAFLGGMKVLFQYYTLMYFCVLILNATLHVICSCTLAYLLAARPWCVHVHLRIYLMLRSDRLMYTRVLVFNATLHMICSCTLAYLLNPAL